MITPKHYDKPVQPWDLERHMESSGNAFVDSRRTDAIEYCFRNKGNMLEDLQKARHCIDEAIKVLETARPKPYAAPTVAPKTLPLNCTFLGRGGTFPPFGKPTFLYWTKAKDPDWKWDMGASLGDVTGMYYAQPNSDEAPPPSSYGGWSFVNVPEGYVFLGRGGTFPPFKKPVRLAYTFFHKPDWEWTLSTNPGDGSDDALYFAVHAEDYMAGTEPAAEPPVKLGFGNPHQ